MWLLSTENLRLVYFHSPEVVPGGYAILSHVWQDAEQSFGDIRLLISHVVTLHDSRVAVKIRETCRIAYAHGYDWVWIDTCCIDKFSSAELSEAINSMFEWYSKAHVCYAYLFDVPPTSDIYAANSAFRLSKWFTRGWTLQELIASRYLIFLSSNWEPLGTKSSLADLIEDISGVDLEVLTFSRDVTTVSVARRMSWAARRQTTRLEDEAYSLMGIFAINMTTIYGEGVGAFRRLQEQILKQTNDHTLFAWGEMLQGPDVPPGLVTDTHDPTNYLFAPSPSAFRNSAHMYPATPSAVMGAMINFYPDLTALGYDTLKFTITGVGVHCQLPVADGGTYALAMLDCFDQDRRVVGLLLHRRVEDHGRLPRYHVGASFTQSVTPPSGTAQPAMLTPRSTRNYRLLPIHASTVAVLSELNVLPPHDITNTSLSRTTCQIKEFYVTDFPPRSAHPWLGLYAAEPQEFFVPTWVSVDPSRYGFRLAEQSSSALLHDQDAYTLTFSHRSRGEGFTVVLGHCKVHLLARVSIEHSKSSRATGRDPLDAERLRLLSVAHPSSLRVHDSGNSAPTEFTAPQGRRARLKNSTARALSPSPAVVAAVDGHDCSVDHIRFWENASRYFGDEDRGVQLAFSRWPNLGSYCLDIRLRGRIYQTMLDSSP